MKKIRKIINFTLGFFLISFIVILFIVPHAFRFYNYGVDTKKTKLIYPSYYKGERGQKYDFNTVLFSINNGPNGINYNGFNVAIDHMSTSHQTRSKGNYISTVKFNFSPKHSIKVLAHTVVLKHTFKNGKEIPFIGVESDLSDKIANRYSSDSYSKIYNQDILPDEIMEYVYVEVMVNGKKEIIEYTLAIEKAFHYSFWDILMGV